jgi:hypothetical protein
MHVLQLQKYEVGSRHVVWNDIGGRWRQSKVADSGMDLLPQGTSRNTSVKDVLVNRTTPELFDPN